MIFSPLEQFEVFSFWPSSFGFSYLAAFFNLAAVYFVFFFALTAIYFFSQPNRFVFAPKFLFLEILNSLASFVRGILIGSLGDVYFTRQYFSIFFSVFFFVLGANIVGLLPFAFTLTSQIVLTFGLSFFLFFAANWVAVQRHGWNYFSLFLPAGSPFLMSPLLVPIEIISYIARVFSLSIRLFANMMAGHCLLKIIAGFAWSMLLAGGLVSFFFFVPFTVVTLVTILEIIVAFLQAYVYCLLLSIYIRDCIHLH
jgi:ATP synthase subunit 6